MDGRYRYKKHIHLTKDTFRPPYFHRNCMSEFMGLISGVYDAKAEGFSPGGASLHSQFTPHGPDSGTFKKAVEAELKPVYQDGGIAFMFESSLMMSPTKWALYGDYGGGKEEGRKNESLQEGYYKVWQGLERRFVPPNALKRKI
jgi:homogentisate 1,2-dioxygenase